ncbi:hypothetical protein P4U90_16350 [Cytobacillus kochii]|uniref:hypothetical protein n=1 Tax=Cytobacillus kochii TaxID=859143 RepID=UPI002E21AC74|nr:hypothetical protein [Cytobacillus kochii]
MKNYRTTAIICKSEKDIKILQKSLNLPFTVLNGQTEKFETGLFLTTIHCEKGLEFEVFIIPFENDKNYSTEFDSGVLYT